MNEMKKTELSPAELQRKYHQNLVFNYSEYPTLDHWNFDYRSEDYKNNSFYISTKKLEQELKYKTQSTKNVIEKYLENLLNRD